jgi:hypothetical protein
MVVVAQGAPAVYGVGARRSLVLSLVWDLSKLVGQRFAVEQAPCDGPSNRALLRVAEWGSESETRVRVSTRRATSRPVATPQLSVVGATRSLLGNC